MQNMNFYQAINPIERAGSEPLNELKVSVRYNKGGINYFNGSQDKRGVYVHFTPCIAATASRVAPAWVKRKRVASRFSSVNLAA